jgi:phosphoribosyl-AMP cyclohydrolase
MTTELTQNKNEVDQFVKRIDFDKGQGLVPVVVQDQRTKDVLMLAYANKEALRLSLETGIAHYWSRSRSSLWKKGETSGHVQTIKKIDTDCDTDTLLYIVNQEGVACHRGTWSCFDSVKKS